MLLTPAHAFECRYFDDHTEVEIRDMEDMTVTSACPDGLDDHADKPLVLYFTSPGGNIDKIRGIVRDMRGMLQIARTRSGATPTVVVREECSSACIPILSGFNQMARENLIHLLIDRETTIGFHGCSDVYSEEPKLRFSIPGTKRYLGYLKELGGSETWISTNQDLFKGPEITPLAPEDRRLQESGILNYAEVVDLRNYRISYQNTIFAVASGRTAATN